MQVVLSGASGFIGSALATDLRRDGHTVRALVRRPPAGEEIEWDPSSGRLDATALAGVDAVVNLAGAGVGDRRWSPARRAEILNSRVAATTTVADVVSRMSDPPPVLVNASAVGYYGDRGDVELAEDATGGEGFLAEVCSRWEAAAQPAEQAGVRVVRLRSGIVLDRRGGALKRQLALFRRRLGGRLGSGRQWVSWITLADELAVIRAAIERSDLAGPVNAVAPGAVTNADFTAALGRALRRPTVFTAPAPALRLALGRQMADEMLLASQRVRPDRLLAVGHRFGAADIATGLAVALV